MSKNTFFKTQKDLIQTGWLTAEKRGKKSHLAASSTGTCLKSGTRSGNVSQNEDTKQTTCLKMGTVTNSNKDNTVENTVENTVLKAGKDAAWVASYLVGQALRGGAR
jgi:outer membrane lipoprotein SlyB